MGILYLDAKDMPGTDPISRLMMASQNLNRYKDVGSFRIGKDDPVDQYIKETRDGIDREQRKLQRVRQQQERQQPKSP